MLQVQGLKDIRTKDVLRYALLPGIIPRLGVLVGSGFGWVAYCMAIIYVGVRLLPAGHPYASPRNIGRFGIRHVIAEAANNIILSRRNIDQIVIFIALLLGFVLLVLQCVAIVVGLVIQPALAFAGMFSTPTCTALGQNAGCVDIAYMLLDRVFAVPNVFNSSLAPAGTAIGSIPVFNRALQELFQYYNYAILIIGVVILLYYVIVVVGETAQTGTPFGRRFNHIYAPLRLVGAIGLLVPLNYGLNSAQYITLYAAKFGSSFATNGWLIFNNQLAAADTPIGTHQESLIARPKSADMTNLVAFMSVVRTCKQAYEARYPAGNPNNKVIEGYLFRNDPATGNPQTLLFTQMGGTNYQQALQFYNNGDITIRFGHLHVAGGPGGTLQTNYTGDVEPVCGEITVHTNVAGDVNGAAPPDQRIGPYRIQEAYYLLVRLMWFHQLLIDFADKAVSIHVRIPLNPCTVGAGLPAGACDQLPDASFKSQVVSPLQTNYDTALQGAYDATVQLAGGFYDIPQPLLDRGWAGAGIWYNHIAEWNGAIFAAAGNVPTPSRMPEIMEKVQEERRSHNQSLETENRYTPVVVGNRASNLSDEDLAIARALDAAYKYWMADGRGLPSEMQPSSNVFFDLLNAVFGIGGLFTMRENDDTHPLAQLSALGKSIIEASIRNLLTSLVFSGVGGMSEVMSQHLGAAMGSISSMFVAFTSIGLAVGFILYYILPFLPFIYFFFAVGGWVKSIFEAMVGVPLWALAHLRIDGNGFPGDHASNGYFLIFEIFIRPILTVFGLLAGLSIFAAMARTLNGVFDLVVENLTGFDCANCQVATVAGIEYKRNVIDEFFFTIIYAILVYMLATSSFKMIDQIPQGILRWMGAGVQSFGDQREDPTSGLVQYAAFGGANMAGQVTGALNQGMKTAGIGVGGIVSTAGKGIGGLFNRSTVSGSS